MRLPRDERREAIIAATMQMMQDKGLTALTTRDVAGALGCGIGLLNHYFRWSDLRAEALARLLARDLEESLTGREQMAAAALLPRLLDGAFAPEADIIWRLYIEAAELALSDEPVRVATSLHADRWQGALAALFRRGNEEKAWRCQDPEGTSWRLLAMLEGLVGLVLVTRRLSREEATRHLKMFMNAECAPQ